MDETNKCEITENYPATHPAEQVKYTGGGQRGKRATAGILIAAIVLSVIFGAFGGYFGNMLYAYVTSSDTEDTQPVSAVIMYQSVLRKVSDTEKADEKMTVEEVVSAVADTVVEIRTEIITTSIWMQQYVTQGAGSGVIISEDGYIITNNHVIEGATSITVTLRDGTEYEAQLTATDEQTDIAILKIDAEGLSSAVLGSSGDLSVGEAIVVIGNPLGTLGGSVSTGIISALDRTITIDSEEMVLLQTDAAINPGNSGGGMFNMYGELIGIVNAKGTGEEIDNIGFAIPIDIARDVAYDLITCGYVTGRPFTGITAVDILSQRTASYYGVSRLGVYIYNIDETSNAYAAGLRRGDLIVSVNGNDITRSADIEEVIAEMTVGETVVMTVNRDGTVTDFTFTLQEYIPVEGN